MSLDRVDRKIIWSLDLTSRQTQSSLSDTNKISKQVLSYRLRKLKREKYLAGSVAVLNVNRLGLLSFRVYMRLRNISQDLEPALVKSFCEHPLTLWVVCLLG